MLSDAVPGLSRLDLQQHDERRLVLLVERDGSFEPAPFGAATSALRRESTPAAPLNDAARPLAAARPM